MIRRILLGIVSLAIILACYLLYTMILTPPAFDTPATTQPVEHTKIPVQTVTGPPRPLNFVKPEDAVMGGMGEKPYFERYSQNRLVYQFRADHWRPDEQAPGKYSLDKPELNLCLRSGQVLRVSATEGDIETVRSKTSKMEPQRGELRGKVHIAIDRATDPDRSDPVLRPEDTIHVWLDKVKFDLVRNIIESDSPIKVESEEVELIGEAILISWNEVTNQIEEILIKRGDKLVLRQGLDLISPDMPFATATRKDKPGDPGTLFGVGAKPAATEQPLPGSRTMFPRARVAKSDLVYPAKAQPVPPDATTGPAEKKSRTSATQSTQPRVSKSYDLVFTSTVRIFQYDGTRLIGKMDCDRLHLLFDVPHGSETRSLDTRPAKSTTKPSRDKDNKRLEVFWEGPLHMVPANLPYSPIRRFQIIATGQPIHIDQQEQGTVRCKKLTYHQETKRLWLDGTSDEPVNVTQGQARMIVAPHLFYDRKAGVASGKGPGFMQQSAATTQPVGERTSTVADLTSSDGQKMMVMWKDGFQLGFGEYEKIDPAGEKTVKQFLKRAEFRGSANMRRENELMAGDRVVINFLGPSVKETTESAAEKIARFHAERNVVLQSDQQQIRCDQLDVEFADGTFGRIPRLAKARGHVHAQEGQRIIQADLLTAVMEDRAVTTPTSAPGASEETGPTPKKTKTKIVIREVDAGGNVRIVDPNQPVNVRAEKMHAFLDPDGTIRWCYLEGTSQRWARARLRDYDVAGERVTMDLTTEQIDIPGPGRLKFVNRQDLVGGEPAKPTPVDIRWTRSMKMTGGKKNQGTFLGKTEVTSDRTTLVCARLLVDFENIATPEKPPQKSLTDHLWVFSRLAESRDETRSALRVPVARKRPTYIQAFAESGRSINILYVVKEGGETANRTTLTGRELTLDLISNKLQVPGEGQFFIEDYRLPKTDAAQNSAVPTGAIRELDDPFAAEVQSSGPSQTVFTWKRGLVYLLDTRAAIFDGTVRMVHASGPELVAEKIGKPELKGKPPARQATLHCDNLKVEFLRGGLGFSDQAPGGPASLKSVVATGSVHLQDKPRSVIAQRLLYNQTDKIIAVYGSDENDAYLYEENADTGQYSMWNGPWIMWDRKTNEIRCPNAAVITTLR